MPSSRIVALLFSVFQANVAPRRCRGPGHWSPVANAEIGLFWCATQDCGTHLVHHGRVADIDRYSDEAS
jgi:hypothetical protein